MKRIAIVSRFVSGFTGTTTTILEHTRRLREAGWEVHVFGEKVNSARITAAGGQAHRLLGWPIGSYFKRRLFAWLFEKMIGTDGFDLVRGHGDTFFQDVLCLHNCVHAAHEAVHGEPLPNRSGVGRIHSRILHEQKFKLLVANSRRTKEEVMRRFAVPKEKIAVIHPGYDPSRFHPEKNEGSLRRTMGVKEGEVLAGLLTSGDFKKRGVGIFLASLRRLKPAVKRKLRVVIIGQETRLKPYQGLARQTGLGERIRFLPPDADIAKYYHALDLYVHPALYEEFGQSVQEAMACGLPVLTSKRVGATELLAGDSCGLLLEAPEEKPLAEALERLVEDASLRHNFAKVCLAACRDNTWDVNTQKHIALYDMLLRRAPQQAPR